MALTLSSMNMKENRLTIIVFLAFAVMLAAGVGYSYFFPSEAERIRLPLIKDCPLHLQVCHAQLPSGGELHFEISPKEPGPTDALQLKAIFKFKSKQVNPEAVRVKFEGKEMYMGYLEYDLKRTENDIEHDSTDNVQFVGKGGLSVCILDLMQWVVLVNVQIDNTIYEIPFEFETLHIR
ncbi:hypothetical protein JYT79_00220 [Cardiobacterium sp. AH-315-I02]|nr:hypothetical protein [Cardiobacterium sp. AH-315-I02]